jgi:thiol-disulfide isomerase/thioredoxin
MGPPPDVRNQLVPIVRPLKVTVLCGVLAAATACSATGASNGVTSETRYISGSGVVTSYEPGHRRAAPVIGGTDLDGAPLSLAQYAGKVVVLNFWASWCPPCRDEAPTLEGVYTATKASGVQFVGVDIRENGKTDGATFQQVHGVTYPSIADESGRTVLAFRSTGAVPETPPSTLIIDRQGKIAYRILGETKYSQLLSLVHGVEAESA